MCDADGQNRPHILLISQCFYPETFRINDIAAAWVDKGYRVTVLTGIPNYPEGKFFKGYGFFGPRRERWKGMEIIRIPLTPRGKTSVGMVLNYLSFIISGFFWNLTTRLQVDLVFSHETSPMTQVLIGCRYAKKHHVRHLLYAQDLWPENVEFVTGIKSRAILDPIDRMVDRIYRGTDEIFVTSPSFVEAIVNRKHPVPRKRVHYWPQYAEEFYRPLDRETVRAQAAPGSPADLILSRYPEVAVNASPAASAGDQPDRQSAAAVTALSAASAGDQPDWQSSKPVTASSAASVGDQPDRQPAAAVTALSAASAGDQPDRQSSKPVTASSAASVGDQPDRQPAAAVTASPAAPAGDQPDRQSAAAVTASSAASVGDQPDRHLLKTETASPDASGVAFTVVFTGNIGKAQGLELLPRTAALLKKEHPGPAQRITFVIVGDGRDREAFEGEIRRLGVEDSFLMLGRHPAQEIPAILACCDAAFLSFMDTPLFEKTIPAKLQSYMACAMPILAAAGGETERIVREADCGICTPTGDERSLMESILSLRRLAAEDPARLKEMGERSRHYCRQHFDRETLLREMDAWLMPHP